VKTSRRRCENINVGMLRLAPVFRTAMTARPAPRQHWRSYGDTPLPTGPTISTSRSAHSARSAWSMRCTCHNAICRSATSSTGHAMTAVVGAGKAELLTGIEGASSRPIRKIVLLG
jgi:hypothetical protein